MKWLLNKNPIRLALVMTLWNLIIGVVIAIVQSILKIDALSSVAGILAIYIVGAGYAQKYNEVMDAELRKNTAGFFCILQYILAFVAYFFIEVDMPLYIWLIVITIVTLLLYVLCRWLLKRAGMTIVKPTAKS